VYLHWCIEYGWGKYSPDRWQDSDDERWEKKQLNCPYSPNSIVMITTKEVPDFCRFKMEQIVVNQNVE
jgi:hypothetical protein